jgi:hypothetical protein
MSVIGWIDRLDDWINPIVIKELRQAVKSRLVTSMLLLFLGLQMVIVALSLGFRDIGPNGDAMNWREGNSIFVVLQAILLGTCMVLIPAYASLRMSAERSDSNVDLLFISTLRPTSIIAGKFFSALVLAMLVFSCCAPFMTFTYLLRGIDIPSILFVLGVDLLAVILSTQVGLFLAAVPAPRALKVLLFFFAFLQLCGIFISLVGMTSMMIREGVFTEMNEESWAIMGVITLAVLFSTGLLFCWSVALISPPSANRALLGRVFLVVMWLILGAGCLGLTLYPWVVRGPAGGHDGPLAIWTGCSVVFFCLQFLISINERHSWGPRVARAIPRWVTLRAFAFLFYSGAAGGVFLSMICVALTLLVGLAWRNIFPTFTLSDEIGEVQMVFGALALYTFCFGMSAVLVRYYLLGARIRPVYTWVLCLLLVGLGMTLPWIAALIIDAHSIYNQEMPWWLFTNPFGVIMEISQLRYRNSYSALACFVFLICWAMVLAALSVRWVSQQIALFHPPPARVRIKTDVEVVEVMEVLPAAAVETR